MNRPHYKSFFCQIGFCTLLSNTLLKGLCLFSSCPYAGFYESIVWNNLIIKWQIGIFALLYIKSKTFAARYKMKKHYVPYDNSSNQNRTCARFICGTIYRLMPRKRSFLHLLFILHLPLSAQNIMYLMKDFASFAINLSVFVILYKVHLTNCQTFTNVSVVVNVSCEYLQLMTAKNKCYYSIIMLHRDGLPLTPVLSFSDAIQCLAYKVYPVKEQKCHLQNQK
ncbi:unnamed protein product [Albugo candida]|uniref:Uncharacterized protein n=1 Tax=Albugo candida TaxID=65357 RepID=A0A024G7X5_9STRA|nr:unnamed protein product [Albugo candida]|eukprot:CCI42670.1 unnamed protein product [Albugo candida]